jgi:hypothetical protein
MVNISQAPGLNVQEVMHSVGVISSVVGGDWVMKKLRHAKSEADKHSRTLDKRTHAYLFKPKPHPLIEWALEFERWREACIQNNRFELSQAVLRLFILGQSLEKAQYQPGFEKLISRLKQKDSFFSAAFEVEVAAWYIQRGFEVRFVEEGSDRSPDLYVSKNGSSCFVECKCRDALTERDKKIEAIWEELKETILKAVGPQKLNPLIVVKTDSDPERNEIDGLRDFLLDCCRKGGCGNYDHVTGCMEFATDPTGKYKVIVKRLLLPDEEIQQDKFEILFKDEIDNSAMVVEKRIDEKSKSHFKNPIFIGFKNTVLSDKVSGIVNAFKSAVGQLKKGKPGVVWIRISDDSWSRELDKSVERAISLLEAELRGGTNTRVNAVVLTTRTMANVIGDEKMRGLLYSPIYLSVENRTPAQILDRGYWQIS